MIISFINEDFDKTTVIANQRHIVAVDLDKTNLDHDNNFDENDTIVHVRLLTWCGSFEKCNNT